MEYISEEQQVEDIKKWWKENGNSIIIGVIIGVSGILGWRYFGAYQLGQSAQASAHFESMMYALESKQFENAEKSAMAITDDYGSTPYAVFAQLSLAKIQFEQQKFIDAEATLKAVVANNKGDTVEFVARKRLADVLLDQKKYAPALDVLSVEYPVSFQAAFEERKGDAYRLQGNKQDAKAAYSLAKLSAQPAEDVAFLQQKMDDLGS
ncbi:MAG: tetratricopeptide repeat protein [Gammaproteobacteria bacterium]|nr:tetratricopeptide repeat protein [Gammaproteobacteria bacterium]